MSRQRQRRKPTFLWQGLLILLPVAALAVVGLSAITQDRAAVRQEARQRAQESLAQMSESVGWRAAQNLAEFDAFARNWFEHDRLGVAAWPDSEFGRRWEASTKSSYEADWQNWRAAWPDLRPEEVFPTTLVFKANGDLARPAACQRPPQPPAWVSALSAEQRQAWVDLQQAEYARKDAGAISVLVERFLNTQPPREARPNAEFIRLRAERVSQSPAECMTNLLHFADPNWDVLSETGVPLAHLALAEALDRAGQVGLTESLWHWIGTEVQERPSVLVPQLLERVQSLAGTNVALAAAAQGLTTLWEAEERLRALAELICDSGASHGVTTTNLWVENGQGRWLCLLVPGESVQTTSEAGGRTIPITNQTTEVRVYPKAVVDRALARAISDSKVALPAYFAVAAELAGEPLGLGARLPGSRGTNTQGEVLAEARGTLGPPAPALPGARGPGQPSTLEPGLASPPAQPSFILRLALIDPAQLFVHQRQRQLTFGALIGLAALAALVGYLAARRAFQRQLRLSELKSNFVSSVSHELRAPLASVRLMAESLERGKVSEVPKQREYFKFIVQECRRLSSLIENVLDFSRIEQGRKQYEFEPTAVITLVEQTVKLMQTYAAERSVSLSLQLPEPAAAAALQPFMDGKAIQQALVNLIDNAIKHSPTGGVVTVGLEVLGRQRSEGRGQRSEVGGRGAQGPKSGPEHAVAAVDHASGLCLFVDDRGDGIALEEQEKIFERFYRPGSELRRQTQGVGIGLSIVKHIIEAHGGKVLVRSAPGQGSRFAIELPLASAPGKSEGREPKTE